MKIHKKVKDDKVLLRNYKVNHKKNNIRKMTEDEKKKFKITSKEDYYVFKDFTMGKNKYWLPKVSQIDNKTKERWRIKDQDSYLVKIKKSVWFGLDKNIDIYVAFFAGALSYTNYQKITSQDPNTLDTRNSLQFYLSMANGWVQETIAINYLKQYFDDVRLTGNDKNYEISFMTDLKYNDFDIECVKGKNKWQIEHITDYNNEKVNNNMIIDLRKGKIDRIRRNNFLLIAYNFKDNKFIYIDTNNVKVRKDVWKKEWNKYVDRLFIEDNYKVI